MTRPQPPDPQPPDLPRSGPFPWSHVLAEHGGRRGIRELPAGHLSLLLDYGISGYRNFWKDGVLHYIAQRTPDGTTDPALPGNVRLLRAADRDEPARVWERVRPGEWYDLGWLRVRGATTERIDGREALVFLLSPDSPGEAGGEAG